MSLVTSSISNSVCTLSLNRADKLNALNREMYGLLTSGLNEASNNDECNVIVIKGTPGIFTAGNDMADFATAIAQGGERFDAPFLLMKAMLSCEKPLLASVDGPAIGIGTTLLFHCDLVYASHGARFHAPFADLGVCPEFAASETFPALLGSHRAAEMLLLGEPLSAADAERFGLVNKLLESETLDQTVTAIAGKLAAKPRDALLTSRKLLHARRKKHMEVIEREGAEFGRLMKTPEFKKSLEMFLSKGKS
ncbi:hypothetical protein AB833_30540 [Chromatiales bacterium (ex Bugula neritina AB1)]|nr:hypothetical protein AB833_30540 [Chromatiales bacterium (ex Bugula neritina AB1)]